MPTNNPFAGQGITGLYDNTLRSAVQASGTAIEANTSQRNQKSRNFTDILNRGIQEAAQAVQGEKNRDAQAAQDAFLAEKAMERLTKQSELELQGKIALEDYKYKSENERQVKQAEKFENFKTNSIAHEGEYAALSNLDIDRDNVLASQGGDKLHNKDRAAFQRADSNVNTAVSHGKDILKIIEEVKKSGGTINIEQPNLGLAGAGRLFGADNSTQLAAAMKEGNIKIYGEKITPEQKREWKARLTTNYNQIGASMSGIARNVFDQKGTLTQLDFDTSLRSMLSFGNDQSTMLRNLETGIARFEAASATGNYYYGNLQRAKQKMDSLHTMGYELESSGVPKKTTGGDLGFSRPTVTPPSEFGQTQSPGGFQSSAPAATQVAQAPANLGNLSLGNQIDDGFTHNSLNGIGDLQGGDVIYGVDDQGGNDVGIQGAYDAFDELDRLENQNAPL